MSKKTSGSTPKKAKRIFTQEEKDLLTKYFSNFAEEPAEGLQIDVKPMEMPESYDVSLNNIAEGIIDWSNLYPEMIVLCAGKSAVKPVSYDSYDFAYRVFTGRVKHGVAETKVVKYPKIRLPKMTSTKKGLNQGDEKSASYEDNALRLVSCITSENTELVDASSRMKNSYYAMLAMLIYVKSDESDTFKSIVKRNEDYKTRCPVFLGMSEDGSPTKSELLMLKLNKHNKSCNEFRGIDKKIIKHERLSGRPVVHKPYVAFNRIYCGESNTSIQMHINSSIFYGYGKERAVAADADVQEFTQEELDEYNASLEEEAPPPPSSSSSSSSTLKTSMRQPGSLSAPKNLKADDYLEESDEEDE